MFDRFIKSLAITCLCLLFAACGSTKTAAPAPVVSEPGSSKYVVTYVIHGDGNYLYHDSDGVARHADQKVLDEAKQVAQNAKQGEVFIFHQKPETRILGLFPKKDRQFFYYRNGTLVRQQSYSPETDKGVFSVETQLYQTYRNSEDSTVKNIVLYFGHEIPQRSGQGYFRTVPELDMNTQSFASGLKNMLSEPASNSFYDLAVLSTCNNGSPDMVAALAPYTQVLLASPQNLHLSHIDTKEALLSLDDNPDMEPSKVASVMAEHTFNRLDTSIQTVISLSLYRTGEMGHYLQQADAAYQNYLADKNIKRVETENTDCISLSLFDGLGLHSEGVKTWYRPPRFGRNASTHTHSGWGCKQYL